MIVWLVHFKNQPSCLRAGCVALFVFLVSRDFYVAPPHGVEGLSAVCDCGWYFLIIVTYYFRLVQETF